jgi:hypothetical protein
VDHLSVTNFAAPFDADWRTDVVGTVAPAGAWHFTDTPRPTASFVFSDASRVGIAPGEQSFGLLLHTQAKAFDSSGLMDLSAITFDESGAVVGGSGPLQTFAPAALAVPEPDAALLLLAGLGTLALPAARRAQSGRRMRK